MAGDSLLDRLERRAATDDELIDALEDASNVPAADRERFGRRVETIVRETTSHGVRNAAAIALIDIGRIEAAPILNDLLGRRDLAGSAGTLVFAMDELRLPVSIGAVLNIIQHGSYEARAEMLILLGKGMIEPMSDRHLSAARQRLAELANDRDEELAEAAAEAGARLASPQLARAS